MIFDDKPEDANLLLGVFSTFKGRSYGRFTELVDCVLENGATGCSNALRIRVVLDASLKKRHVIRGHALTFDKAGELRRDKDGWFSIRGH